MRIRITVLMCLASVTIISAQGPDEYWIGLEEYAVHTDGTLAGMTTWRMYLHMLDPDDYLSACTGSEDNPWIMVSTSSPAWYQHPEASQTFANSINPVFYTAFPELEYDSWLTIGVEDNSEPIEIMSISDPTYDAFSVFEAGEDVISNTAIGNGWATFFPGLGATNAGFAGDDLKILIAQLTTSGTISGSLYVQIFPWGIQDPDLRLLLPILYAPGCMNELACNYGENPDYVDVECLYIGDFCDDNNDMTFNDIYTDNCECIGEISVFGCTDEEACNYDDNANNDNGSCWYANLGYNCEGECLSDLDEDGICDACEELEFIIVDCNCFNPATYTVFFNVVDEINCIVTEDCYCECFNDFDGDGICDEDEVSGCTYDSACNYDPEAEFDNNTCVFVGDPCDDEDPNTVDDEIQDDCECAGTPISTVDELEALSVLIYPNPASNNLTVDLGDLNGVNTTIKFYDSSSKLVFEKQSTSTLMIDVSGFAKGMYALELTTDEQVLRSQVIME